MSKLHRKTGTQAKQSTSCQGIPENRIILIMDRTGSFSLQFGTYFHAACLAAHANQGPDGFRQKDF